MGLENRDRSRQYVHIKEGMFETGAKDAKKQFTDLTGQLVDIDIEDDEYQGKKFKRLTLTFADGTPGDRFLLQLRLSSGYARSFVQQLPNADLTQPMGLSALFKAGDQAAGTRNEATIFVRQPIHAKKSLPWFWKKDDMKDMPPLKKVRFNNEDHWDGFDQQQFIIGYLLHTVKPKLIHQVLAGPATPLANDQGNSAPINRQPAVAESGGDDMPPTYVPNADDIMEPLDDLPF